jgi:hypothetical protein
MPQPAYDETFRVTSPFNDELRYGTLYLAGMPFQT